MELSLQSLSGQLGDGTYQHSNFPIYVKWSNVHSKDINDSHWSIKEISYLADKGVIQGYPDGYFRPND
ncbi:S-layer homology domain-containing protein [Bacillus sp. FJAT-29790]|uniref:S-layer homology domain-containing protein n=1 Tax=Bacillus sp. FJAT-29790 TaxID=1895002 RepID=UPI001C217DF2|nr:S-layer homology domain-containing protein [Bacillus sp. FJAT-29790]MBU8881321.1 S-layer homology domain-containing protein [Bacillus sp. FJAT-29790]